MDSSLTLISLSDTKLQAPLVSYELLLQIQNFSAQKKKGAFFYNRRGSGRAWICQDCSYYPLCPHCDIALAYHVSPRRNLLCHQCNHVENVAHECPQCHGNRFDAVGIGIQKLQQDLEKLFPTLSILRIDSDTGEKKEQLFAALRSSDLILGTYNSIGIMHQVDYIVFVLFESDLTVPDYRMEEEIFHALDYAKKLGKPIFIQTRLKSHPLLDIIMEGNYRDFLTYMSHERELFEYPPYTEFVTIRIHDRTQSRVTDMISKLANKIALLKKESTFFSYDQDIWDKASGEWIQKIILKDKSLEYLLSQLQVEILRNRSITLEWR